MSLARWWDRLARRRRSGATTTEPPAAGHPRVAAAATPPPTVATTAPGAARSPEAATETSALPDELDAKDDAGAEADKARRVRFFCWLVGVPAAPGADAVPSAVIPSLLERLDQVIASESLRAGLLPRAPHVVPQLMKTLRDEHYSSVDVANRIAKDVVLTAEVVRSATSAFRQGEDDGEIDLARAVAMIGTQGLRRAIANVVLRPIFDARGNTLSARAARQVWKDADKKARLCAALASHLELDPLDGYLAGLLHNSGWTAALRAIDGLQDLAVSAADLAHAAVVPQILRRRDTLFGALVEPWQLSPA
ncbi:MAG: HDOD domain-containing protein, partial [Caldimonas sp.]